MCFLKGNPILYIIHILYTITYIHKLTLMRFESTTDRLMKVSLIKAFYYIDILSFYISLHLTFLD